MRKLRIAVIIIFIGAAALFAAYQVRTLYIMIEIESLCFL